MAVFIVGEREDKQRRQEILGDLPPGWPDVVVTSLPDGEDLSRPSEFLRLMDAAEQLGASGFRLHDLWSGDEMEVRIKRPLPPPHFL